MMPESANYADVLRPLGLDLRPVLPNTWQAGTGLGSLFVEQLPERLRIELQLLPGVRRNKVALWNVVHHNNHFVPFGQFYINPQGNICLGTTLPRRHPLAQPAWLPRVVYELVHAGESHHKSLSDEFAELPFDEADLRANLSHLVQTDLNLPEAPVPPPLEAAAATLAQLLDTHPGPQNRVQVSTNEFGLTLAEQLVTLTLEPMPFVRKRRSAADWLIGIRTEVGVIATSDDRLWVRLNRLNAESHLLAYAVRYQNRRAAVGLSSELPADFIQHPDVLYALLDQHAQAAGTLLESLSGSYRIQIPVTSNLGL